MAQEKVLIVGSMKQNERTGLAELVRAGAMRLRPPATGRGPGNVEFWTRNRLTDLGCRYDGMQLLQRIAAHPPVPSFC